MSICETGPEFVTYSSLTLPHRTLAVISVHVDLTENSTEHIYEVKPNSFLMNQYPNIVSIPVIHIMPMGTDTIIPFIITNLSTESIFLSNHKVFNVSNNSLGNRIINFEIRQAFAHCCELPQV